MQNIYAAEPHVRIAHFGRPASRVGQNLSICLVFGGRCGVIVESRSLSLRHVNLLTVIGDPGTHFDWTAEFVWFPALDLKSIALV
jgi:hypothetical protein